VTIRAAGALLLLAGLGAAAPAAAHEASGPTSRDATLSPRPALSVIRPAPDFTLHDPDGRPVRLGDLRGRVVVVSFVYTRCADACPILTGQLARLQARLGRDGERVRLLTITVDPERDTAPVLAAYARRFGADPRRWRFLGDAGERLAPVLAAYGEWTRPLPDGTLDHPARLYLIDGGGRIREIYALGFFDERQALLDIRALLREDR
jgi:protein SCO1/2